MATTEFDTLATADELRAAGIQARHAKAIVTAVGRSRGGLLTASRFEAALGEIRSDMKADRAEYVAALRELRSDMKADRAEYVAALAELKSEIYRYMWLQGGAIIVILTSLYALVESWARGLL